MMHGHAENPILFNKKYKDWTSRTLAIPRTPLRPITSQFCLNPHPPQSGSHMCISPKVINELNDIFHYLLKGVSIKS